MALSRRQFAISSSLMAAAPFVRSSKARANEQVDVVIIGSGLSGLNAAWILSEAGLDVTVLEGADRIGGRAWTSDTTWRIGDEDVPIELGCSQVGPSYARVIDALERLQLETYQEDRDLLPFAFHIDGHLISADDWPDSVHNKTVGWEKPILPVRFANALLSKFNPCKELDDWLDPRFSDYDISFYELFKQNGISSAGMRLAQASAPGNDLHSFSCLNIFQERIRGALEVEFAERSDGPTSRVNAVAIEKWPKNIVGGSSCLPDAMAARVSREVHTNKLVSAIDMESNGADVRCMDGSRYRAKYVISAVPFSVLRYINIWPSLQGPQLDATLNMGYTDTTRAHCRVKAPFWQEDGFAPSLFSDTDIQMFWAIDNHKGDGEYRGMFVMGGRSGQLVSTLPPEKASAYLVSRLEEIRPAAKGQVEVLKYHSWGRQPLQLGCRHRFKPGQVTAFANDMILPHTRLHFAGEHTRRLDYGMEAAMESGERAALEVLDRIV